MPKRPVELADEERVDIYRNLIGAMFKRAIQDYRMMIKYENPQRYPKGALKPTGQCNFVEIENFIYEFAPAVFLNSVNRDSIGERIVEQLRSERKAGIVLENIADDE